MVLRPCARPPKQPMVLLYMVQEGLVNGFKTMARPPKQPMVLLYMVQEGLENGFNIICKAS